MLLLQDVQIDRRALDEGHEAVVDVLDDEPLLWFSLPAALHEEVHFLWAGTWPFKLSSLRDALNGLERGEIFHIYNEIIAKMVMMVIVVFFICRVLFNIFNI